MTDNYCRKSTSYFPTEYKFETELSKRALTHLKVTIYSPLMKEPII